MTTTNKQNNSRVFEFTSTQGMTSQFMLKVKILFIIGCLCYLSPSILGLYYASYDNCECLDLLFIHVVNLRIYLILPAIVDIAYFTYYAFIVINTFDKHMITVHHPFPQLQELEPLLTLGWNIVGLIVFWNVNYNCDNDVMLYLLITIPVSIIVALVRTVFLIPKNLL